MQLLLQFCCVFSTVAFLLSRRGFLDFGGGMHASERRMGRKQREKPPSSQFLSSQLRSSLACSLQNCSQSQLWKQLMYVFVHRVCFPAEGSLFWQMARTCTTLMQPQWFWRERFHGNLDVYCSCDHCQSNVLYSFDIIILVPKIPLNTSCTQ